MAERGTTTLTRHFPRIFARAATSGVNLVVGGCAALAAAALHSWAVAALGGIAYVTLVAWDVSSGSFWRHTLGGSAVAGATLKLPAPDDVQDPRIRDAVRAILSAQDELTHALHSAPEAVRSHLGL